MKRLFLFSFILFLFLPSFARLAKISDIGNPEIASGTIQVSVVPTNANVTLESDGKYYTLNKLKTMIKIPAGTYILKVQKEGYQTYTEKLILGENKVIKRIIKLSNVDPHLEYRQISRHSGEFDMKPFFKSMIVPGWGQISNGQKKGYFYLASFIGAAGWYYSAYSRHSKNMDEYNNAKDTFDTNPTVYNALLVNASVNKTDISYEKGLTALYVLCSLYVINLCDALFLSNTESANSYSIKPYIINYNACAYSQKPLFGLTINW